MKFCCFGCCAALLPTNGLQRFVLGTILLMMGSGGWLVPRFVWKDDEKTHAEEEEYGDLPALIALVLSALVLVLSVAALIVHILCVLRLKQLQKADQEALKRQRAEEDAKQQEEHDRDDEEKTLFEWFFYPERETVPAARQARTTERMQSLVQRIHEMYRQLGWSSRLRVFLLAPAVALFAMAMVRLFWGADTFEGLPYHLDFGWKLGLLPHENNVFVDGNATSLSSEPAEKNTAFRPELNTYIHAGQGLLSALLAFPVVVGLLLRPCCSCAAEKTCTWRLWKSLVQLAPFALAMYPTYNLIKRMIKAGDAFAGSTFANNSLEWAVGFLVGLAIGNLWTSIVLYWRLTSDEFAPPSDDSYDTSDENEEQDRSWFGNKKDESPEDDIIHHKTGFCVRLIQLLLGTIFAFTICLAAILYGLTWHGCIVDDAPSDECVNYSPDGERAPTEISVTFLLIAVVSLVGASVMECCQRAKQ